MEHYVFKRRNDGWSYRCVVSSIKDPNERLWLTAKEEEEEAASADYVDYSAPALGGTDQWSSQIPDAQWNNEGVQAAIPAVPRATGWTAYAVPSADGWDVAPEPTLAAAPGLDITQPAVVAPTWE
uniref:Uncharacterized protein n=1 Tax=Daucus carota subsp. sativus TaxID=79200 RepID=A0A175YFB1_DAUCS